MKKHTLRDRKLSTPAIKHLAIFNMASAILQVRNFEDVTSKAVNITKDKKVLNKKRKLLLKVNEEIKNITNLNKVILSQLNFNDLNRVRKFNSIELISTIPETTTNPELLALYLMYINFQDDVDSKMDCIFDTLKSIDYFDLIIKISEDIGLEQEVQDDMYLLADRLITRIK